MVAGVVTLPRIDLRNRDLIRSHLHAIWMEVVKPDLGKTLTTVLELTPTEGQLPLLVKEALVRELEAPPIAPPRSPGPPSSSRASAMSWPRRPGFRG